MMRTLFLAASVALLLATAAAAQPQPIFDPDDFVDPRTLPGPLFISHLVLGAVAEATDDYRPLHQSVGVLHLANSIYWSHFQFAYKHSEIRGNEESGPEHVTRCGCNPPIYFPTPPPDGVTPTAPLPSGKRHRAICLVLPGLRRAGRPSAFVAAISGDR